jgi:hypothetical protein
MYTPYRGEAVKHADAEIEAVEQQALGGPHARPAPVKLSKSPLIVAKRRRFAKVKAGGQRMAAISEPMR